MNRTATACAFYYFIGLLFGSQVEVIHSNLFTLLLGAGSTFLVYKLAAEVSGK